jgi:hypothetical protein
MSHETQPDAAEADQRTMLPPAASIRRLPFRSIAPPDHHRAPSLHGDEACEPLRSSLREQSGARESVVGRLRAGTDMKSTMAEVLVAIAVGLCAALVATGFGSILVWVLGYLVRR